jgi:aryl-alcohol dehydrogenase-like predicted oxidoreductase
MNPDTQFPTVPNTPPTGPNPTMTRLLGRSGMEVSALGFGCWAIGGPWTMATTQGPAQAGWGSVDDDESVRALHAAMAGGITFFDTAANYGAGHSETVLGRAIAGRRSEVVLATKFGYRSVDAATRHVEGIDTSPEGVRRACAGSLRRLGTDWIDLFQLHVGDLDLALVDDLLATLEDLVAEGSIRAYGWSTDDVERARRFATGPHCTAVQHQLNLLQRDPEMLDLCETLGLASINRGPLAMGLLTGAYDHGARFPADDIRAQGAAWMRYFVDGQPNQQWLERIASVRDILTAGGRTLAQGAIGWIWASSPVTVPIPGMRTVTQSESNAAALQHGPLTAAQLAEVNRLLA